MCRTTQIYYNNLVLKFSNSTTYEPDIATAGHQLIPLYNGGGVQLEDGEYIVPVGNREQLEYRHVLPSLQLQSVRVLYRVGINLKQA